MVDDPKERSQAPSQPLDTEYSEPLPPPKDDWSIDVGQRMPAPPKDDATFDVVQKDEDGE